MNKTASSEQIEKAKLFRKWLDDNGYTNESFAREAGEKAKTILATGTDNTWLTGTEPGRGWTALLGSHYGKKGCPLFK